MSEIAGPTKELDIALDERKSLAIGLNRIPPVDKISEVHRIVVMAAIAGFTNVEIAKMVNLEPEYVGQIRNWQHPVLDAARQEAKDRLSGEIVDITQRLKFHASEALDRTVGIMRGNDVSNARLAAKDIMDRAGYAPIKRVAEVTTQVPSEEFMAAVKRMDATDEVVRMKDQFKFQAPVKVVEPPKTGTNG